MKILAILFLAVALSLSPSLSFCRDAKKYTTEHNKYVLESLSKELYAFISAIEKVENNWDNRRYITTSMFDIIDKYNCQGKLYIVNRGLNIKLKDNKISVLLVTIFVMNSLEYLDTVLIQYDIDAVKKGDPINIQSDREKV